MLMPEMLQSCILVRLLKMGKNQRLLAFAGRFNFNSWLDIFRKQDPG